MSTFERLKLHAKDEFGVDIERVDKKSSFRDLFEFDPVVLQKLQGSRSKIALYYEPWELAHFERWGEACLKQLEIELGLAGEPKEIPYDQPAPVEYVNGGIL